MPLDCLKGHFLAQTQQHHCLLCIECRLLTRTEGLCRTHGLCSFCREAAVDTGLTQQKGVKPSCTPH